MKNSVLIALVVTALLALACLAMPWLGSPAVAGPIASEDHTWTDQAPDQETTCNSCADCSTKLASGDYVTVTLSTDLLNLEGTCIDLLYGESDVTFDCAGHTIDGDDLSIDRESGIAMLNGSNNKILNCTVSGFDEGIYLENTTSHTIIDNDLASNDFGIALTGDHSSDLRNNTISDNRIGIYIRDSNSDTINANVVCSNSDFDFYLESGTGNTGDNNTCDRPDGWNDQGTTGCTFLCTGTATCNSCLDCTNKLNGVFDKVMLSTDISNHVGTCITFGADNVEFNCDNHTIDGDDTGTDYGVHITGLSGSAVKHCTVRDFQRGVYLSTGSDNTIDANTLESNISYGIFVSGSSGNTISRNTVASNGQHGMYLLYGSSSQISRNNLESNTGDGIHMTYSSGNTISENTIASNGGYGMVLDYGSTNQMNLNNLSCNPRGIKLNDSHSNTLLTNEICSSVGADFELVGGSSGNSGDLNTCDAPGSWNDTGTTGCTWTCDGARCATCSDAIQNANETGTDCGGTYCPPCSQCSGEPTNKYAPPDTPCNNKWPTSDGPDIGMNTTSDSCNLVEVCDPDLDFIVEDALTCCEHTDYDVRFGGSRANAKINACDYAHQTAYRNSFTNLNPATLKQCLAHYIIRGFGAEAVYMQGYFYGELCCHGNRRCPSDCSKWGVWPRAWQMGTAASCAGARGERPDFQMTGHRCVYNWSWFFGESRWGEDGWWSSDTNWGTNNDSFADIPAHASIDRLSTGTCVDYSFALTTALRKAGFSKDDALSVNGEGHAYNILRLPGESKWHYVDTTGNKRGGVYGGAGFSSLDYHCCRGTPVSCAYLTARRQCERAGCTWDGSACSGEPDDGGCRRAFGNDEANCTATPGCSWEFCVYDYCRSLDDGCSNDAYSESRSHCPANRSIYGCESVVGTYAASAQPSPMEVQLTSIWHRPPEGIDQDCTELHPCTEEDIADVPPPGTPVDLDVHKWASSEEIVLGEELVIGIEIDNHETTGVDTVVLETFVPDVDYDLATLEESYEELTIQYNTWDVAIPAQSTETLTFTAVPRAVGYYTFASTSVSANGNVYGSPSPIVKVVCNPNGSCDPGETYIFCQDDCTTGIQDGYCDMVSDGINDPDCVYGVDPDCDPADDTDGDGVLDGDDQCPLSPTGEVVDAFGCACSQKICADEDPETSAHCDPDTAACEFLADGDGDDVPDSEDNCRTEYNPTQYDTDNDGTGDQCEILPINADTTLDGGTYYIHDFDLKGAVVITASGVTLDCHGATINGTGSGYGIYIPAGITGVRIENCTIRGYRYGIYVDTSANNLLVRNTLESNAFGIVLGASSGSTVAENVTNSNTNVGVYLEGCTGIEVLSNTVSANDSAGIFIHTSSGNTVSGNTVCKNSETDFYVYASDGSGDENVCTIPDGWNDAGTIGCSYACIYPIYLPIILRSFP
jgi:parallel beta-helix repeat protein